MASLKERFQNVSKALRDLEKEVADKVTPEPYRISTPREFDELLSDKNDAEAIHEKINQIPKYLKEGIVVFEELSIQEWKFVVVGKSILIGPVERD